MNVCYTSLDNIKYRVISSVFFALLFHLMLFFYINSGNSTIIIDANLNKQISNMLSLNLTKVKILEEKIVKKTEVKQNSLSNKADNIKKDKPKENSYIPTTTEVKLKGDKTPPHYPNRALKLGQEGKVLVEVLLDKDGKQIKQEVINSSGYVLLDKAALEAIKKWSFLPHKLQGENSKAFIQIPIEFKIS
jgi:TonB family protein